MRTYVLAIATTLLLSATAAVAAYPERPLRFVVPFPPGGSTDTVARLVAQRAGETLGQQIIIDNRSGASGSIGVEIAARAAPDGYTWCLATTSTHAIAPATSPRLPYDPIASFNAVSLLGEAPYFLLVHQSVAARSVKELITLAQAQPGRLHYASAGTASLAHFAGELFKVRAGVDLTHVPYKGSAPALVDMLAGRVEVQFGSIAPALPHIQTGRLRALAVTSARRITAAPAVPTVMESGLPDYEAVLWMAVLLPRGVSQPVATTLNRVITATLAHPQTREALLNQGGLEPRGSTPDELTGLMKRELVKWGDVARRIGPAH